ncbi:MFS general substrate transporter [Pleurostoma richardsiae]|uniref:MFS general substrate transporter n=1 Tax=Pleurostoma richardsiae TaxID=41990 RepID=A0AA38RJZ1_9PEZI|nr:MFS general substrate transporter [Pleurostoma richardsiae]
MNSEQESKVASASSSRTPDILDGEVISPDYAEYVRLSELFVGEKLDRLVRKIDFRILPQLIILYLLCYIDRSNAGNAKLFGALNDMHLSGQDWNTALCVFFATYALGGVPSNIALKRYGPKSWLPALLAICGIINIGTGCQSNMAGFTSLRLILGIVEAGIYPGCSYVLTNWYSPRELHGRMTVFYSGASLASAFSGLLAYGIGQLDHTWGYRGWRFIYVIEGLVSVIIGVLAFFFISPSPENVSTWLDHDEKQFLVLRKRFLHGGESGVGEKDTFSMKHAKLAFRSVHVYAVALVEFTVAVVVYGISFVLPTIVNNLGYSALKAQAMSCPPYVFACIMTLTSGFLADRYRQRMLSVVIPNTIAAIGFVIIIASVRYPQVPGVTYFGIFLMAGGLYCISPAVMAWTALNCAGSMKRAVGMALMLSFSQLGGIVGSNIFIANQAPTYPVGFGICLGMLVVFGIIWPLVYWVILKRINAARASIPRDQIMAKYTEEELADLGDMSPLFKYAT